MTWLYLCAGCCIILILILILVGKTSDKSALVDPIPIDISRRELIVKSNSPVSEVVIKEQKIPKIIIQTNDVDELSTGILLSIKNIRDYNPEYKHLYFNDDDCAQFIQTHFSDRIYSAFSTLVPGAYRSDFFRTCFLIKNGGVYLDTGFVSFKPLREIIESDDIFIVPEDNRRSDIPKNKITFKNPKRYYIHNAMIASIPNHPILKNHLDIMVNNIESKNYTRDCHSITGPGAIGKAFYDTMGFFDIGTFKTDEGVIKILRSIYYKDMFTAVISPEIEIDKVKYHPYFYTKTLTYRDEQKRDSLPYYGKYYECRQVFGEPGKLPTVKEAKKPELKHSNVKKFSHAILLKDGYTKIIPTNVPRIVHMPYTQKIPKNIIQFTSNEKISYNMYNAMLSFLHLNPEYNYYHFSGKTPEEQKRIMKTIGGFLVPPEMVCVMPFRDFIDPEADTIMIGDKIFASTNTDRGHKQKLTITKNNFSNIEYITDTKEHGGLPNRVLIYTRYHSGMT